MNTFRIFKSFLLGFILGGSYIWTYRIDPEFFSNLSAQILGGALVAAVSFYFINRYSSLFSKPNLKVQIKRNGKYSDSILFEKKQNTYEAQFDISIKNSGNKSLSEKQAFWHFYIVGSEFTYQGTLGSFDFTDDNHFRNMVILPIFQMTVLDLNVNLKINFPITSKDKVKIYAWVSSEYGNFPKSAKINNEGLVEYVKMQSLSVNYI